MMIIISIFLNGCHNKLNNNNNIVFYEIFTGSFSDSNNDGIGDLNGIINRIPYLKNDLGIEGIWLTPIFESVSYHKYDVIDYYKIDPDFGNIDDLKRLIETAHSENIRIILDLVINHTSDKNDWFKQFKKAHRLKDISNPYYDYYSFSDSNKLANNRTYYQIDNTNEYYEANFSSDMPELNFDSKDVRNELLAIAEYYLDLGIDGFRYDAAKYIYFNQNDETIDFWSWFNNQLKKKHPNIYLVSEVWSEKDEIIKYSESMNCFDFDMAAENGYIIQSTNGLNLKYYTEYIENYQNELAQINKNGQFVSFITNHDMDRAAEFYDVDNGKAYLAASLNILTPGSPFIYYGEEIGMKGSKGNSNNDSNRRLSMLWGDEDSIKDPPGSDYPDTKQTNRSVSEQLRDDSSLLNCYKKLLKIRKEYPQIANGTYASYDLHNSNLGGFKITFDNKISYLIHNNSGKTITIKNDSFKTLLDQAGYSKAYLENTKLVIGPYTSAIIE